MVSVVLLTIESEGKNQPGSGEICLIFKHDKFDTFGIQMKI